MNCKMGRCLKNVEKPLVLGLHLGVMFTDYVSGLDLGLGLILGLGFGFECWV